MNRSHTPVTISICTPEDPVKDFVIKQWEEFGFTYEPDEDQDLEDIQKYYMDQGGIFYVMRDTDQIIGTIGVRDSTNKIFQKAHALYLKKGFKITQEDHEDFTMERVLIK